MKPFETIVRSGGTAAIQDAARFFMQSDPVFESLRAITSRLGALRIPYAVLGGMALVAHGYRRTTEDIDILISPSSLKELHESLVGLGFRPLFEGSKNIRDVKTGVRIEFVLAGQFPGDGKPKPVAFPEPEEVAVEIDGIKFIALPKLIELKLASGMTNPGRLRDLADVQELIRVLKLPAEYVSQLNSFVRDEFLKLAGAVNQSEDLG